jgi:hypothetical protein
MIERFDHRLLVCDTVTLWSKFKFILVFRYRQKAVGIWIGSFYLSLAFASPRGKPDSVHGTKTRCQALGMTSIQMDNALTPWYGSENQSRVLMNSTFRRMPGPAELQD